MSAGPSGFTAPRPQQPAPPTRRRGRDWLGIHVTTGRSRAPQASSSHPFHAGRETRLLRRKGAADYRPSAGPLAWPGLPPPGLLEGQSGAQRGAAVGCRGSRLGAAAETGSPHPGLAPAARPPTHLQGLASAPGPRRSRARPLRRPADLAALGSSRPGARGGQWRLRQGGGSAHARKASAPTRELRCHFG